MITTYQNGIPFSKKGFGVRRNTYASGRIEVGVAEHGGIFKLAYIGTQSWDFREVLSAPEVSVFTQIFRIHIVIDDIAYRPEFHNTEHFPFGYRSECKIGKVRICHEFIADNDALFHRIKVVENPDNAKVTARICQSYSTIPEKNGRTSTDWVRNFDDGTLTTTITDNNKQTNILIGCSGCGIFKPITYQYKAYILSAEPSNEHLFYISFNHREGKDLSSARIDRKFIEFEKLHSQSSRFETGEPTYDSALQFMPLLTNYLEIPGHPGAFRASPIYWVWGWDSMVHCDSLIYTGHTDQLLRMLLFFKENANPEFGIQMAYETDFSPTQKEQPVPVQAFYLIMLYHYYAATDDKKTFDTVRPFARQIAKKIANALVPGVDLVRGRAYFPDFPHCIELTNHDFSTINNSVCYQGMRAWLELTGEFEAETTAIGKAINRFFDDKEGMWVDSIDGDTLEQRRYHPVYGQFYISPFAHEPQSRNHKRIAEFMKKHLLSKYGIWMLPPDRKGFMADGGQLGEYFPAIDRSYWNIMNVVGDSSSIEDHMRIVTEFWKNLTYPEGETNDVVNIDPSLYEDDPGMKQLFTAKSWVASAVDLNLGLRWNLNGITFNPLPGSQDFAIYDMILRGKKVSFIRKGSGSNLNITYGDKKSDAAFIAWDELKDGMVVLLEMK